MTETIRPGNTHTFSTHIADENGDSWDLSSTSVIETIRSLTGTTILEHTLIVDAIGVAIVEDGITLVGDAEDGRIERNLTAIETAALSDGWYRYDLDLIDTTGNRFDIEDGAWKISSVSPITTAGGTTRRDIRRDVLRRLGDLLIVTATEGGSTTTFVDRRSLVGEPDAYRGRFIRFTGGTIANLGEIRYISGSSRSNRSITFDDDLPAVVAVGDEAELVNMHGTGYRFQDVDLAIDSAFRAAADFALEPAHYESGTFSDTAPYIQIPPDWVAISGVDWQDYSTDEWHRMSYHHRKYGNGWTVDRTSGRVYVSGETMGRVHNSTVRLVGYTKPVTPINDEDTTQINSEWLVARCISELSTAAYRRMPTPEKERVMGMDMQNEQSVRSRVTKRSSPNTVRLV